MPNPHLTIGKVYELSLADQTIKDFIYLGERDNLDSFVMINGINTRPRDKFASLSLPRTSFITDGDSISFTSNNKVDVCVRELNADELRMYRQVSASRIDRMLREGGLLIQKEGVFSLGGLQ